MESNFTTTAHAKCILAGEHAVLYGCPAIVSPIKSKNLKLSYYPIDSETIHYLIETENHLGELFLESLKKALLDAGKAFPNDIKGLFKLENNIEIGGGIGFSAALCVVIGRWFVWKQWILEENMFDFVRSLENLHHGKSSGIDIVGAMSDRIVLFNPFSGIHPIQALWQPKLYLSYSGLKKNTKEAVLRVHDIRDHDPKRAQFIDQEMKTSVCQIEHALGMEESVGIHLFAQAIKRAASCFEEWELVPPILKHHIEHLYELGAFAVKPTGAGLGGYVLSLWHQLPPIHPGIELLEV